MENETIPDKPVYFKCQYDTLWAMYRERRWVNYEFWAKNPSVSIYEDYDAFKHYHLTRFDDTQGQRMAAELIEKIKVIQP
jgi:hypothetical protein